MSQFDTDTQLTPISDSTYSAYAHQRWAIGDNINGGFLLALLGKVVTQTLQRPHPITISAHYLAPTKQGPIDLSVENIQQAKSSASAVANLHQDGQQKMRAMAIVSDLSKAKGFSHSEDQAPLIAAPEQCIQVQQDDMDIQFRQQVDLRVTPASAAWVQGHTRKRSNFEGWMRLADGRDADVLSLLMFADAMPPPIFSRYGAKGWVPTMELTVHIHRVPKPGWVRCRFHVDYLASGYATENGYLWDSSGELVAVSRQLSKVRF